MSVCSFVEYWPVLVFFGFFGNLEGCRTIFRQVCRGEFRFKLRAGQAGKLWIRGPPFSLESWMANSASADASTRIPSNSMSTNTGMSGDSIS